LEGNESLESNALRMIDTFYDRFNTSMLVLILMTLARDAQARPSISPVHDFKRYARRSGHGTTAAATTKRQPRRTRGVRRARGEAGFEIGIAFVVAGDAATGRLHRTDSERSTEREGRGGTEYQRLQFHRHTPC
jgi:hypothetical protein